MHEPPHCWGGTPMVYSLRLPPALALLLAALGPARRSQAWVRAVGPVAPPVAELTAGRPRVSELRDTLRHALEDAATLTDRPTPGLRQLRQQIRDRRRRLVADLE